MSETLEKQSGLPSSPRWSISSAVDWLSCSAPREMSDDALWIAGNNLLNEQERRGNTRKVWKSHDLKGFICGQTVCAVGRTHTYVQVSSSWANAAFPLLMPLATRVSRLDLQTTAAYLEGETEDLAERAYEAVETRQRGGAPLTRTRIYSTTGGATCYLGSRRSDVFGRVYDKGVESGLAAPRRLWRWELELKREVATLNAAELYRIGCLEADVAELVSGRFSEWGIELPGMRSSTRLMTLHSQATDRSRLLDWLRRGVAPAVRRLIETGPAREVVEALGLAAILPG